MSRFFRNLATLVVVLWQIDMAVNMGIAASKRQRPVRPSPSVQQQPPQQRCTTGKCALPTPTPTSR